MQSDKLKNKLTYSTKSFSSLYEDNEVNNDESCLEFLKKKIKTE